MYFISPVKYWARVHNGLILGGIKSDKSQILHEARQYDLLCGPDWEMWRMKEADEDNERAGTAIWPEEMVAHSLTLETLETLVTTPSSLSADLALAQLIVSTPLCSLCSALVFKISKHNPQKASAEQAGWSSTDRHVRCGDHLGPLWRWNVRSGLTDCLQVSRWSAGDQQVGHKIENVYLDQVTSGDQSW